MRSLPQVFGEKSLVADLRLLCFRVLQTIRMSDHVCRMFFLKWVKNLCKKFLVIWDWRLLLLRILPPTFPSQSPANCPFRPNLLSTIVSSIHSNSNWNLLLQSYFSSNIGKSSPGEETVCSQLFTGFLSAHRFLQNVFVQIRKCSCQNLKDICPNY